MWHDRSRRRITGGKIKQKRKKRKHEMGRETLNCKIMDNDRRKMVEVRGNRNQKQRLQFAEKVNLTDPQSGETAVEKLEDVVESPANPHFVRRDIVTKGCIVRTSGGKARVTSRPGQNGQVNAVKVEE